VLAHRPHPEQGFRTCLGILRLYRGIDPARAEAVSARAVEIGALTYKSIVSIITHKLDKKNSVEDGWTPAQTHALGRPADQPAKILVGRAPLWPPRSLGARFRKLFELFRHA
jgi:hypothetical protein